MNTEERILKAGYKVFSEKGYSCATVRDISAEAGVNAAMINYYFRNKEKLYARVMTIHLQEFVENTVIPILSKDLSLDEKIDCFVDAYTADLLANPDQPLFLLNQVRSDDSGISYAFDEKFYSVLSSVEQDLKKLGATISMRDLIINFMGLSIFPLCAHLLISATMGSVGEGYEVVVKDRKDKIKHWLKAMIQDSIEH